MKTILPLIFALCLPFFVTAQESKPVFRFSPFYTQGIGIEETRFIESLVESYLSDLGTTVNYFDNSFPSASPDYVISGSIYLDRDLRIFTLEIYNSATKETSRSTTVHKTTSDLALKARSLVENAVKLKPLPGIMARTDETPEPINENSVSGTWRGESGIEMIRLQQGGRGIAFFSSGAQMTLSYVIEDNILKVRQNSPNSDRFYYPLPYDVAKKLSLEADPMCWELLLYSGGSYLKGVKISTEANIMGNELVELVPKTTMDSLWIRSNR